MIEARLRKTFPAKPDSAAFSLELEFQAAAGVTVLFGPSGSGKTLTLDLIAGFVRADEGRILLDNEILFDGSAGVHLAPQARNCGYVFQNYALFPHMTLRQNLEFAAERRPRLERHRRVNEMIEKFRLADVAGRRPHELSGGQRQRCSIARALIGAPKLLLLDEPAQGLDAPLRAEFYEVLRQVRADFKTPVLLVTHDLDECFELGEEMLVLHAGKLVQSGMPRKILDQPANLDVARLLGVFNLLAGEIRALDPGRNTSRVQVGEIELDGPYFPGHLKGDRVTVCTRPEQLTALPRNGKLGPNQLSGTLERAIEKSRWMRLEFSGGIAVELAASEYARLRDTKDWAIEFPRESLRVL
jgi:molybdate transport system ATP-binding protein